MSGSEKNYVVRYSEFKMAERDISELRKDYWGNGKDGTKIEVIKMKKDFERHKEFIIAKLKTNNTLTLWVLIALVGNLIRSFF